MTHRRADAARKKSDSAKTRRSRSSSLWYKLHSLGLLARRSRGRCAAPTDIGEGGACVQEQKADIATSEIESLKEELVRNKEHYETMLEKLKTYLEESDVSACRRLFRCTKASSQRTLERFCLLNADRDVRG